MIEHNDWRLTDQERYLKGVSLRLKKYKAPRPGWDHDHCEFCWARFMELDEPEILHEGYTTEDDYRWICQSCYNDFKDTFGWILEP